MSDDLISLLNWLLVEADFANTLVPDLQVPMCWQNLPQQKANLANLWILRNIANADLSTQDRYLDATER